MEAVVNSFYYQLKPLIPRRLQIWLRTRIFVLKRGRYANVWPILEKANQAPEDWRGWPQQKQFALVLTHDVETEYGHGRCLNLMKWEQELGFKSSFNFVPERYRVSPAVRHLLSDNGFEVGVHGLKHDGKLYQSEEIFTQRALRINKYLDEWNAVGFRSPAMHHNLEWLHALNIEYDLSTFDTDPFEPQSDGVQTIFPFWVRRSLAEKCPLPKASSFDSAQDEADFLHGERSRTMNSSALGLFGQTSKHQGYVEMPYTLPQDHALYIIKREKNIDTWKRKLDWIVDKGGMALLNTHPDYMNFNGMKPGLEEYPVELYLDFLEYIRCNYEGQYWHALPKEMARFWNSKQNSYQESLANFAENPIAYSTELVAY